ncbi:MAG: DUF1822 family protein [Cyanobacteria bacterium J06554_6]
MTHLQQDTNAIALVWPITHLGRQTAERFSQAQGLTDIAERVRRNTLAVWAVHDFLAALGVETDLTASDSWNPVLQAMEDVADLMVTNVGQLDCRLVCPGAEAGSGPREVESERVGWVMVSLDEAADEVTLLGFAEAAPTRFHRLRPMEALPEYLHRLAQETASEGAPSRLRQWLDGCVESAWQTVEAVLIGQPLTPAFRQSAPLSGAEVEQQRARPIHLALSDGMSDTVSVALVVAVRRVPAAVDITVRLYPLGAQSFLPENLTLKVVDETDRAVLTAQARLADNYIQVTFDGQPEERFHLVISLGEARAIERFVV